MHAICIGHGHPSYAQINICGEWLCHFVGLAYQGKDIVFGFIREYSTLRDFGPLVIGLFLYDDF
jgi:hypothetical protein